MAGGDLLAVSIHCKVPNFGSDRLRLDVRSMTDGNPRGNGVVYDNPGPAFNRVKIVYAGNQGRRHPDRLLPRWCARGIPDVHR